MSCLLLPLSGFSDWNSAKIPKFSNRNDQVAFYDDAGALIRIENDADRDGCSEKRRIFEQGRLIRIERDTDRDLFIDCIDIIENGKRVSQEKLDPEGNLIQVSLFDENGKVRLIQEDTTGDHRFNLEYHFKAGLLVSSARDKDDDGRPDTWITFKNQVPVKQKQDMNQNGIMEKVWEFDSEGRLVKIILDPHENGTYRTEQLFEKGVVKSEFRDTSGDGKPDVIIRFEKAMPVFQEKDSNLDGRFDRKTSFKKGLPVSQERDTDFDGVIDWFAEYDDNGQLVKTREATTGAGILDRVCYYKDGLLNRIESDQDKDGFFETASLMDHGSIIKQWIDKNQDGKPDVEIFFDKNQNLIRQVSDLDFDGYFETSQVYDNPAWSRVVSQDTDADRNADVTSYYSGTLLKIRELDENSDGVLDAVEVYRDSGTLEKIEEIDHGDITLTWFYDDQEQLVRGEQDRNRDGKVETWYLYEERALKRIEEDTNLDGTPDLWEEVDETQAVIKRTMDLNFDGTPDFVDVSSKAESGS